MRLTWLSAVAISAVLVVVWELIARFGSVPSYILPQPREVVISAIEHSGVLSTHALATLKESLAGLGVAIAIGTITATILYFAAAVRPAFMAFLVMFNSFPKIALAPLLIVWFGLGFGSKVVLSAALSFFPIVVNTLSGLLTVDQELIEVMRMLRASPWSIFTKIRLPHSLPMIVTAIRVAIPLSVIGALVGEFVGATQGLGYLLLLAGSSLDSGLQFATLIAIGLVSLVPYIVLEVVRYLMMFRWTRRDLLAE